LHPAAPDAPSPAAQALGLLLSQRWGCLATLEADGSPLASMVAYAVDSERRELLFHLSRLAAHTRHLLERPRTSLAITAPDTGEGDPQLLARLSLQGEVTVTPAGTDAYVRDREIYLARLPTAEQLFLLGDFTLFRFRPRSGRFVGGFGRAFSLKGRELWEE